MKKKTINADLGMIDRFTNAQMATTKGGQRTSGSTTTTMPGPKFEPVVQVQFVLRF
ncbi:hypothetical protein [uncultured Alistipes sp.]|uniref:hypothetical protein n=1 Tax=uncultured Alistipes sp. TaxID=538949 RepID=UPI002630611C|nr:hypothetical protein [uncultured Alistipes sp.]